MSDIIKERRSDKQALYKAVIDMGGRPAQKNMFHCFQHNDATASAWIKCSKEGYWYFRCFTCNFWVDVWDLESRRTGKTFAELVKEYTGTDLKPEYQTIYKTLDELVSSLEAIAVEEINTYTNPDTGNADLVTIRYLERGGNRKKYAQGYQTDKGFIRKRPVGQLPLFNRVRLRESDTVIFVEGEKCVRELTKLGFVATTGSGGASNAALQDLTPLSGKSVYLWADNDVPGRDYMASIADRLQNLQNPPHILSINIDELDLPVGGDVCDLIEKVKFEGGTNEDCQSYIETLLENSLSDDPLSDFEELLDDMRSGKYQNLGINDFPILTNEAKMLLNKRIAVIYGNAGFGKSLFIGKACDDLVLSGVKAVRLQLEDELQLHLLRSFAQQLQRAELANEDWHKQNVLESRAYYEQMADTLTTLSKTIVAGEDKEWDADSILEWIESKLAQGYELVVVDPISVIMTDKIWITSHRLMWGTKKILANYPNGRVVFISHNNTEGEVAGGLAFRRFCHSLIMLNKFKTPKKVVIVDKYGEEKIDTISTSIGIAKTRYGPGNGIEIATRLNPTTLCIDELGIILKEIKETTRNPKGNPIGEDVDEVEL